MYDVRVRCILHRSPYTVIVPPVRVTRVRLWIKTHINLPTPRVKAENLTKAVRYVEKYDVPRIQKKKSDYHLSETRAKKRHDGDICVWSHISYYG